MNFQRVWAVVLRHLRLTIRDFGHLATLFYWPLLDMLLWSFTGRWIQSAQAATPNIGLVLVIGMFFWQIINRSGFEIALCLVEELYSYNIVNLFSTPLRLREWIVAAIILSLITAGIVGLYCFCLIKLVYGIELSYLVPKIIPFIIPLFLSGSWIGFMTSIPVIYIGVRAQALVWIMGWLFAPFIGAFYPLEVLPSWAQKISYCLPMTYIFEGMRAYFLRQESPLHYLCGSLLLSFFYNGIFILLFAYTFKKSKQYGLARLVD